MSDPMVFVLIYFLFGHVNAHMTVSVVVLNTFDTAASCEAARLQNPDERCMSLSAFAVFMKRGIAQKRGELR